MSRIIGYLDNQSDIQLLTDFQIAHEDSKTTDLFFLLEGKAALQVDDEQYQMGIDDLVIINKHQSFNLKNTKNSLLFHFSISDFLLSQAFDVENVSFNCNSMKNSNNNYDLIRKKIAEIIDLFLFENEKTNFLQLSHIYYLLNELSSLFIVQSSQEVERSDRITQVLKTIKERYYENISLQEMADLVHMDVAYFSKFFKKKMGLNYRDYVTQIRMGFALRDMAQTDKTITRISIDNGFFSVNSFNKKFKELYNQTPSEYREQLKAKKQEAISPDDDKIRQQYAQYKENKTVEDVSDKVVLRLNLGEQVSEPIKETWRAILNIGEAKIVLNSNIKRQLTTLNQRIGYRFARIWSVFNEEVLGEELRNYEMIDEILDSLIELDLTPWLSINKFIDTSEAIKEIDYDRVKWQAAIHEFCEHIVDRYGKQEVKHWRVELILENGDDQAEIERYCLFYQATCQAFKQVIPQIRIGGGNFIVQYETNVAQLLNEALADCSLDFYSFALFPYARSRVRDKRNSQRLTDPNFMRNQLNAIKAADLKNPVYISEWSSTVSRSNLLNDTLYKGAYLVKNMIDLFDAVDGLGYWLAMDIAQKKNRNHGLLSGGNGLLNKNGLIKPAMHAMSLFNELKGLNFLYKDENHLVCSTDTDEFFVLGHQYTHPNSLYFLKDESQLKPKEIGNFFEETKKEHQLTFLDIPNGKYEIRVFSCQKGNGDLFSEWENFNFNKNLRVSDLKYLQAKITHLQTLEEMEVKQNRLLLKRIVATNEFYLINIKKC